MNVTQAKRYIRNSPTVERERFTWTFTQETQKETSMQQFKEAIRVLGGWVCERSDYDLYPNPKYHSDYRKHIYRTIAAIPDAV